MNGMRTFHVRTYDGDGVLIRDFTVVDETDEGPDFYAHHLLHADGVVCVDIRSAEDDSVVLQRCDPGVEFDEVVR
jgi:hypothetical protein